MLDLKLLLKEIKEEEYCIIKLNQDFPSYHAGQDLDIFCYHPEAMSKKILKWANPYLSDTISIDITLKNGNLHLYVDILENKEIHFRFDLYGALPHYQKLLIKPAFFESVVENRVEKRLSNDGGTCCFVPSPIDDIMLRYFEFVEWYDVRPDKIKHLEFLMAELEEEDKPQFMRKLHHYTALPETRYEEAKVQHFRMIRYVYKKLKGKTPAEIFSLFKRKLFS